MSSESETFVPPTPSKPVDTMTPEERAAYEEEVEDARRRFETVKKMKAYAHSPLGEGMGAMTATLGQEFLHSSEMKKLEERRAAKGYKDTE